MAYNNNRYVYSGTDSIRPITAINALPEIQKIEQIQPQEAIQPIAPFRSTKLQKRVYNKHKSYLANYNDPTELNSALDALVNREAVSKEFGDFWGTVSTAAGVVAVIAAVTALVAAAIPTGGSSLAAVPAVAGGGATAAAGTAAAAGTGAAAAGAASAGTAVSATMGAQVAKASLLKTLATKAATKVSTALAKPVVAGSLKVAGVAALPSAPAQLHVAYNYGMKPLIAGQGDIATINMLQNLGETMDMFGNPVKGLILDGPDGFVKASGLSKAGRVNYDYDTGSVVTDMFLEVVSDPLNWVQFGGGIGLSKATKPLAQSMTDDLVTSTALMYNKSAAKAISEKAQKEIAQDMYKKVQKAVIAYNKALVSVSDDASKEALLKRTRTEIRNIIYNAFKKEAPDLTEQNFNNVLKSMVEQSAQNAKLKNAPKLFTLQDIQLDNMTTQTISSLATMTTLADDYDRFLRKAAIFSSGNRPIIEVTKFTAKTGLIKLYEHRLFKSLLKQNAVTKEGFLNIFDYANTKTKYLTARKFVLRRSGALTETNLGAFYTLLEEQISADFKEIRKIVIGHPGKPIEQVTALENFIQSRYQKSFKEYADAITKINVEENGRLKALVQYIDNMRLTQERYTATRAATGRITTSKQLFHTDNGILKLIPEQQKLINNVAKKSKTVGGVVDYNQLAHDQLHTLKLDNAYVNATLLNSQEITELSLDVLDETSALGSLIQQKMNMPLQYATDADLKAAGIAEAIYNSAQTILNLRELYDGIASLQLLKIPGMAPADLKRMIISQIVNQGQNVEDLLLNFNYTMQDLMTRLKISCYGVDFSQVSLSALSDQIAQVYLPFLQKQSKVLNCSISTSLPTQFTESLDALKAYMIAEQLNVTPEGVEIINRLSRTSSYVNNYMIAVHTVNNELSQNILSTAPTIFEATSARQLNRHGLAIRTAGKKQTLDMFTDESLQSIQTVAEMRAHIAFAELVEKNYDNLLNYWAEADASENLIIRVLYEAVYEHFQEFWKKQKLSNKTLKYAPLASLKHLDYKTLSHTEFALRARAQLMAMWEYAKDTPFAFDQFKQFYQNGKEIVQNILPNNPYLKDVIVNPDKAQRLANKLAGAEWVFRPDKVAVTDFAWEGHSQSAWTKPDAWGEEVRANITRGKELAAAPKKCITDMQSAQEMLADNRMDRIKRIQKQRHIDEVIKIAEPLDKIGQIYDDLYDPYEAIAHMSRVQKALLLFPELANTVIDKDLNLTVADVAKMLERYYNGDLVLKQTPKYAAEKVDEFTPFYEQVKKMNDVIKKRYAAHNKAMLEQTKEAYKNIHKPAYNKKYEEGKKAIWDTYYKKKEELKQQVKDTSKMFKDNIADTTQKNADYRQAHKALKAEIKEQTADYTKKIWDEFKRKKEAYKANMRKRLKSRLSRLYKRVARDVKTQLTAAARAEADDLWKNFDTIWTDYKDMCTELNAEIPDLVQQIYKELTHKQKHLTHAQELNFWDTAQAEARRMIGELRNELYEDVQKATTQVRDEIAKVWDEYLELSNLDFDLDLKPVAVLEHQAIYEKYSHDLQYKIHKMLVEARKEASVVYEVYDTMLSSDMHVAAMSVRERRLAILQEYNKMCGGKLTAHIDYVKKTSLGKMSKREKHHFIQRRTLGLDKLKQTNAKAAEFIEKYPANEYEKELFLLYDDNYHAYRTVINYQFQNSTNVLNQLREECLAKTKQLSKQLRDELAQLRKVDFLEWKNVSPWAPMHRQRAVNHTITSTTRDYAHSKVMKILTLDNVDDLKTELAYRKRFIWLSKTDVEANQSLVHRLQKVCDGHSEIHFIMHEGVEGVTPGGLYIVLDSSEKINIKGRQVYLNGNLVQRNHIHDFSDLDSITVALGDPEAPSISKLCEDCNTSLNNLIDADLGDSTGEALSKEMLSDIYDNHLPDEIKKVIGSKEDFLQDEYFTNYIFNESILGGAAEKRMFGLCASDNLLINMRNAITNAGYYANSATEYINVHLDSLFSINSDNSIWQNFTDEQLLEALQSTREYKLVVLVDDPKYGVKVREIVPVSTRVIAEARRLDAVIVPDHVFKNMVSVMNHRIGADGFLKIWSRIMYVFKSTALIQIGAAIRNWIDTNGKTLIETGSEYFTYKNLAKSILDEIDTMHTVLRERSPDGVITKQAVKEYFENIKGAHKLTYEQYVELMDDYFSVGVSGGLSSMMQDEAIDLWGTYTNLTGKIVESLNATEAPNRLALYLYNLDHGKGYTGALYNLAKTHFDYSYKSVPEQIAELIIPFVTFKLRGLDYFAEQAVKHPWLFSNYVHIMKPHWQFARHTPEEIERSRSLRASIINGHFRVGDTGVSLKVNPSIQNYLNLQSQPVTDVMSGFNPLIKTPIDVMTGEKQPRDLIDMVPGLQVVRNNVETMARTKTPVPSFIKVTNKNYKGMNTYTDKTYRTPRYRKNVIYDAYKTKGTYRYRMNMFPIIDIAHDVKSRYSVNVYNRIKNKVQTDVYQGVRYRIRLDANRFR